MTWNIAARVVISCRVGSLFQDLQSSSKCGVITIKEIDNIAYLKNKNKIFMQANISPTRL